LNTVSLPAGADGGGRQFLASAPRGLADLLARELVAFGAVGAKERSTGVAFTGDLRVAYRACLESRIANRVFLELGRFEVADAEGFYRAVRGIDWSTHLAPGATLACDFSGRHPLINHTHFGALKLKDAIVDTLRDSTGARPDVALDRPSVRVHAHANGSTITVSLDLSGESLHRRGYRGAAGEAPLKENVAAGMLMRCGWPEMAAAGAQFLDPMCGSGTLVIEAALIAADIAPGLGRDYYGFIGWRGHDPQVWQEVLEAAEARARTPPPPPSSPWSKAVQRAPSAPLPIMRGSDRDRTVIRIAQANADRAGVGRMVSFEVRPLADAKPAAANNVDDVSTASAQSAASPEVTAGVDPPPSQDLAPEAGDGSASKPNAPGLMCVNPPYGVRLEDHDVALATHRELGTVLRERFKGWIAGVLIGSPELGMELGIRAYRTHALWNGALECRLLRLRVDAESEREPGRFSKPDAGLRESPGARMFGNRLAKNLKRLQSWATKSDIYCYRVYDADMPEYAFAIDIYRTIEPDQTWLYVQEYAAPVEIELDAVRRRRNEALSVMPEVTGIPQDHIHVRTRRRNKRGEQYKKVDEQANFHFTLEAGLKFRVNFDDYLDTGLFLDHRITRSRLREAASGKRFLNLFAYTGTATVYAAAGGAKSTTTVDMSRTYLDWAQRNLSINGCHGHAHELVQADCREWLQAAAANPGRYDLIFLDPPTFSNSKRMEGVLDIERDHGALIDACAQLLAPGGLLVFSTNAQKFRLDDAVMARYNVRDISAPTLPRDFERNPRIHRCFEIRAK
jgi:23S rRNA (guanine2445-N2)-methyltransferase / 23S rRNA (guanine2069-N7)-methyltransferase